MSRALMYVLVLPLLAAEVWAQFVANDQRLVALFAVLALGVLAVRWITGPEADACPPNCRKCAESESLAEGDR
ncbi:hypothetical protein ACIQU3_14240 [Streptomyces sp. NPDC101110]|uniref:hypothetical protein n=1 Tax=Streptomyces sp. NPDC101110 TaxID=3366104 RepID=UPI00381CB807